ncbi:hypothetical protein ACR30L_01495 [Psychromonas sp. PT13]|uniref:hypothetical protein n=1 Tax=Psychromonas sp. PT13 TaxID=3439547 RepID=UPI003EBD56C9
MNVHVSFLVEGQIEVVIVYVNTLVYINDLLGKGYIFFVIPFHKFIKLTTLKNESRFILLFFASVLSPSFYYYYECYLAQCYRE